MPQITTLATDLDGTFIPLNGDPAHASALKTIEQELDLADAQLVFVTGRSWDLVCQAMQESNLPKPDIAICDVGCRIMRATAGGYEDDADYVATLNGKIGNWTNHVILDSVCRLGHSIRPQRPDQQTAFKTSFDFDVEQFDTVRSVVNAWIEQNEAPLSVVMSKKIDQQTGLLDLLPAGVNKAFALHWWIESESLDADGVVFAGDSGNDAEMLDSGVKMIVVGNADDQLRGRAEQVNSGRVHFASAASTSGVLEGWRHFRQ
jgi:sucrose-6F-phosphate phosphohydrolase